MEHLPPFFIPKCKLWEKKEKLWQGSPLSYFSQLCNVFLINFLMLNNIELPQITHNGYLNTDDDTNFPQNQKFLLQPQFCIMTKPITTRIWPL